ncbi:MAG: hypothetical protein M1833_007362 [Piccolia ochrophora]|nr:MAG: hypothetical protein M1833_007362 [Piccolia ochrophora]
MTEDGPGSRPGSEADPFSTSKELWRHPSPQASRMYHFLTFVNKDFQLSLQNYHDLYGWSIRNLSDFWGAVWSFSGIKASQGYHKVLDEEAPMYPRPAFFEGARLNFAENLLYPTVHVDEDSTAVIAATEDGHEHVSWKELRERVKTCATALKAIGVQPGHVVGGFLANHTNTVVAMLASTSVGAIWSGISPDMGVHAVLERLKQIEPVIFFADNAVVYNGKQHDVHDKVCQIIEELQELKAAVIFETVKGLQTNLDDLRVTKGKAWAYEDFSSNGGQSTQPDFAQLPADHPVYILYSSGTTGKPKCIVHGAIGTLIQHKKEHDIHCDIRPGDRFFYFTTCTWMMWHWLVSGLAVGATIILYDGSPFRPTTSDDPTGSLAMPALLSSLSVTHFGTSAKYLSLLEQKSVLPQSSHPSPHLRAVYSTGSPLAPSTSHYVYRAFGNPSLNLGSITGGTDIISLFGAPCPLLPVHAGEVQCLGLGMAVEAWDPVAGHPVSPPGSTGDLVCTRAFPCQPVAFFGADGPARYEASYFTRFPGVWHHGDFIRLNPATGGMVMLGRSDGVLKPAGVRFGSAEIYNVLLKGFPDDVADALCVGRRRTQDIDETVVLFLKMAAGEGGRGFGEDLVGEVKTVIRQELSARHVPGVVDACPEIPVTTNGKKVEAAVKQILSGTDVKVSASVANAECLEWYRQWAKEHP